MCATQRCWFAVETKPRSEKRVLDHLRHPEITTFLPEFRVQRRHGSRRWQALEPLFPGYLFARFRLESDIVDKVRWTPGVRRLLGDGENPTAVPDDVIDYLLERIGESGYVATDVGMVAGTKVRFRNGPFALLEGIIERRASRSDRVRVLLQILNAAVPVEVSVAELETA